MHPFRRTLRSTFVLLGRSHCPQSQGDLVARTSSVFHCSQRTHNSSSASFASLSVEEQLEASPKLNIMRGGKRLQSKKRKRYTEVPFEGANDQVLAYEVSELLRSQGHEPKSLDDEADQHNRYKGRADITNVLPERDAILELKVSKLSSTGDSLATSEDYPGHAFVVPFSMPGEVVKAKVIMHDVNNYSTTDLVEVVKAGAKRHDELIGCKYFGTCSGCQLQMMKYEDQLDHKKGVVETAYRAFSNLRPEQIPRVGDTMPSPLKYGYRTKLTPHYDMAQMESVNGVKKFTKRPDIGFAIKGRRKVLDIEDCPIGTDILRKGFQRERELRSSPEDLDKMKNGATILLRESTTKIPITDMETTYIKQDITENPLRRDRELVLRDVRRNYAFEKRYVSDNNGVSTEYIDDWEFESRAGSFFQNNNSILSPFTAYVRDNALGPKNATNNPTNPSSLKYLLDAYCGTGLFTITLSPNFTSSLGVECDPFSIICARANATKNKIPNTGFISADASALFAAVPFPADQTVMVIDPPRKGCSEDFIKQLLKYGPKRVIYVSCNVNTQARDVGMLVRGKVDAWKVGASEWMSGSIRDREKEEAAGLTSSTSDMSSSPSSRGARFKYEMESLIGCDFFPQTGHVEGVAILNRVGL